MRKELTALRKIMKEANIDWYYIPTGDFHGSEYIADYFKGREFISGFDGSAGDLLVSIDQAFLWTDGRYFIQAEEQLKNSCIKLMKLLDPSFPSFYEFLDQEIRMGQVMGFDGRCVMSNDGIKIHDIATNKGGIVNPNLDLVNKLWDHRPPLKFNDIYPIPPQVTGKTPEQKISQIRSSMKKKSASHYLVTALDDIAWIFNLRGSDVECSPVFFAYTLITQDKVTLYVDQPENIVSFVDPFVNLSYYNNIYKDLKDMEKDSKILVDQEFLSYTLLRMIPKTVNILDQVSLAAIEKAKKNPTEIGATRLAHIKDGMAMVTFSCWLKSSLPHIGKESEISVAEKLSSFRKANPGYMGPSFPTISAYGSHGAIVHYEPTQETDIPLDNKSFLLVDSGGQYDCGTTDITRTFLLGEATDEMKLHYTTVLKSHIRLATNIFKEGTTGYELDQDTRVPLRALGFDYNHGTGHGVGHMLCVHEGPTFISHREGSGVVEVGLITSDEPGVYFKDKYGIRIEDELLCKEAGLGLLEFESITLCPFEREAIEKNQLTEHELNYVNQYHDRVYNTLKDLLGMEETLWLKDACRPL